MKDKASEVRQLLKFIMYVGRIVFRCGSILRTLITNSLGPKGDLHLSTPTYSAPGKTTTTMPRRKPLDAEQSEGTEIWRVFLSGGMAGRGRLFHNNNSKIFIHNSAKML